MIEWKDPPAERGRNKIGIIYWRQVGEELAQHSGQWALVRTVDSKNGFTLASKIRDGQMRTIAPFGQFESRFVTHNPEDGYGDLYVRHIGDST